LVKKIKKIKKRLDINKIIHYYIGVELMIIKPLKLCQKEN
jgi:hypothetical protein